MYLNFADCYCWSKFALKALFMLTTCFYMVYHFLGVSSTFKFVFCKLYRNLKEIIYYFLTFCKGHLKTLIFIFVSLISFEYTFVCLLFYQLIYSISCIKVEHWTAASEVSKKSEGGARELNPRPKYIDDREEIFLKLKEESDMIMKSKNLFWTVQGCQKTWKFWKNLEFDILCKKNWNFKQKSL